MKKHIGIYKNENAVREALKTNEIYNPYLVYVEDFDQVMYNAWTYIDQYLDWNMRDSISVAYNDASSHFFNFNCYTNFWYEVENASQAISFSNLETTGYTSSYGCYFTVGENQGDDRALTFTVAFREEENGPVVYRLTYTINQSANNGAVVGWFVDGAVTTENIQVPQIGGTAQIKFKNVVSWSVLNNSGETIYSGTTDDVVTVSFAANETYDEVVINYMVEYMGKDGNGGSMWLTAVQEGLEPASITLDNYAYHEETYNDEYFLENTSTAVTVNFSNLSAGNIWEITDENDNILASGTTDTSYDVPVVNNTGVTLVDAFEYSGTQFSRIACYVWADDTKENLSAGQSFIVFKLPSNACMFSLYQPTNTGDTFMGYSGGVNPVVLYNYDGKSLVGDSFTSTSSAFTDTWYADNEEIGLGWRFIVNATPNLVEEDIPITYAVTVGVDDQGTDDDTYTLDFVQGAYIAPAISVSYQTNAYDSGLHLIRYNSQRARVTVNGTLETDVVEFSTDGENWDQLPNNRYEVSPLSTNTGVGPITVIPNLYVKVVRDGMEILNWGISVAQDTSSRPWIGWDSNPENEIYLPEEEGEGGSYKFIRMPGNDYTFVSASASGHGFSTYIEDGEIVLETQYNDTGAQIDGSITAIFEDGEQNQVSYTVTVHQPIAQGA